MKRARGVGIGLCFGGCLPAWNKLPLLASVGKKLKIQNRPVFFPSSLRGLAAVPRSLRLAEPQPVRARSGRLRLLDVLLAVVVCCWVQLLGMLHKPQMDKGKHRKAGETGKGAHSSEVRDHASASKYQKTHSRRRATSTSTGASCHGTDDDSCLGRDRAWSLASFPRRCEAPGLPRRELAGRCSFSAEGEGGGRGSETVWCVVGALSSSRRHWEGNQEVGHVGGREVKGQRARQGDEAGVTSTVTC